ncbi:MAG: cytochrome c, partial [Vicinamibacterales bacterium]
MRTPRTLARTSLTFATAALLGATLYSAAGAQAPVTYPAGQVKAGAPLFAAYCGFCHGRDAMGGETGP